MKTITFITPADKTKQTLMLFWLENDLAFFMFQGKAESVLPVEQFTKERFENFIGKEAFEGNRVITRNINTNDKNLLLSGLEIYGKHQRGLVAKFKGNKSYERELEASKRYYRAVRNTEVEIVEELFLDDIDGYHDYKYDFTLDHLMQN